MLNEKKDEFIGFASHELKTPLTTISGYIQLAEREPSMANEFLPRIRKQVDRLTAIISDLLDISKIHAGKLELNFSKTNLTNTIQESVDTVRNLSANHPIKIEAPAEDIIVIADSQKIGQVLINILTNAIKYSPGGGDIVVSAMLIADRARIGIRDSGVGIAKAEQEKIFSQFYRVQRKGESTEGLGIGLYISKEIMEGHHGAIWVESEEGKGSTFFIEFPIDILGRK